MAPYSFNSLEPLSNCRKFNSNTVSDRGTEHIKEEIFQKIKVALNRSQEFFFEICRKFNSNTVSDRGKTY